MHTTFVRRFARCFVMKCSTQDACGVVLKYSARSACDRCTGESLLCEPRKYINFSGDLYFLACVRSFLRRMIAHSR